MKITAIIILVSMSNLAFSQLDSVKVFFMGNKKGERYRFYVDNNLVLDVTTNTSYKYSFNLPIELNSKAGKSLIDNLYIYRKGKWSLFYRQIHLTIYYKESDFLVFWRSRALKNRVSLMYEWTNSEPKKPVDSRI